MELLKPSEGIYKARVPWPEKWEGAGSIRKGQNVTLIHSLFGSWCFWIYPGEHKREDIEANEYKGMVGTVSWRDLKSFELLRSWEDDDESGGIEGDLREMGEALL